MASSRKVTALINFRDRNNFEKEYKAGDDISHFDEQRIDEMISKGYAVIDKQEKKAKK